MADTTKTLQSGIKQYDSNFILNYSLFLGGLNVTQKSLEQYDPLKTGYNRIFFVKMPVFMKAIMPDATKRVRHILEYGFTEISGIGSTSLETDPITGGYSGKSFEVATASKDDTSEISITTYEFAGSPMREYMDMWISGISDPYTGIGTYHGAMDITEKSIEYKQSNHVAEAIYVATGPTGRSNDIEYACLLSNMMPKQAKKDQFNYSSGQHNIVTMENSFTCVKYESPQINEIAKKLIDKYQVMADYLEFDSLYRESDVNSKAKYFMNNWPDKYNTSTTDNSTALNENE